MGRPKKRTILICKVCGAEFEVLDCELKKATRTGQYCSVKCAGVGQRCLIPREVLIYLYREIGFSSYRIGEIVGCSNATVLKRMREFNIPLRTISERARMCKLGKKHTRAWNRAISRGQLNMSDEARRRQVAGALNSFHKSVGRRPDLNNQYFRSRWEANYARLLNFFIKNGSDVVRWEYEPDTFEFKNIKRGTRFYTPDFKVFFNDGHIEYHEVKGWDYPKGITARKRFARNFPHLKLMLIDGDYFKAIKRQGIDRLINNWE